MRAGLLKDRITFQKPVSNETDYSASEPAFEYAFSTNARVVHSSGNKVIDANEVFTQFTVKFEIRRYHKVSSDMVIVHDGNRYRILDINPDKTRNGIIITAEVINE